jgi:hypothetical protein
MNRVSSGLFAFARAPFGRLKVSVNVCVGMPAKVVDRPMSVGWVLLKTTTQRSSSEPVFSM